MKVFKKNVWRLLVLLLTMFFFLSGCQYFDPAPTLGDRVELEQLQWKDHKGEATDRLPIVFYYDGICTSCATEEVFRASLTEALEGFEQLDVQYTPIDVVRMDGHWKELVKQDFPDAPELRTPAVRVGKQFLVGETTIELNLRQSIHEALGKSFEQYIYYYHPDCPDCIEIETDYASWKKEIGVIVEARNVQDEKHLDELKEIFSAAKVPEASREIPFIISKDQEAYWTIDEIPTLLTGEGKVD